MLGLGVGMKVVSGGFVVDLRVLGLLGRSMEGACARFHFDVGVDD